MNHLPVLNTIIAFFQKESSKDSLRNIITIIFPSILVFYLYSLPVAIAFGVGILLSALTDIPGNLKDKKLTALITIPAFFIAGLCASYSLNHLPWLIVPILALFGFLCNFSLVLGPRIGVIGNLTLIVISFTLGLRPAEALTFTFALIAGTIAFFCISVFQTWISPTRSLKYAMDDGFASMAQLIRLKVKCYNESIPLDNIYKELSLFHIKVSEQLEIVRSLLLRETKHTETIQKDNTIWLNKTYRLIDLYELLMANDYDYETIRLKLANSDSLPLIRKVLIQLAEDISTINSKSAKSDSQELKTDINDLKKIIKSSDTESTQILSSILDHILQIQSILLNIRSTDLSKNQTWINHNKHKNFVSSQISLKTVNANLTKTSTIFMYSIRMAVLLTIAASIGYLLPEFRYASWIILTIILVARPSYLITQKRNFQRITGSAIGLLISVLIILFITNIITLLLISAISLYLFYLFNKPNYLVCVIFITITIIITLNIYEGSIFDLLGSRFSFTLVGSILAILGCLAIPINHVKTVEKVSSSLTDNYRKYLFKINEVSNTIAIDFYELRLARKHSQTSLAMFYDAIEQYSKEPGNKRNDFNTIDQCTTIAYRINALLISLSINLSKSLSFESAEQMETKTRKIDFLIDELENITSQILTTKK